MAVNPVKRRGGSVVHNSVWNTPNKKKVIEMFAGGATVVEVCRFLGIHKATFYRWLKDERKGDFQRTVELGIQASEAHWIQVGRDNLENKSFNTSLYAFMMVNKFNYRSTYSKQEVDKTETKNAIMAMAYNAKQLNMTDYEIKNEFITGYNGSFNIQNVQSSGTFQNIKQQLRQNAATYMIKLDDTALTDYANKIYLGKATYEGITAGHAQAVMETEPALKSLVEQGYTPSAYFSTYSNAASQLLGRNVDFLGVDNKMFRHIKDSMQNNDGLNRPMTRGEFERYVRATPEWDYSDNARDEAYSTVDTLLNSFGVKV